MNALPLAPSGEAHPARSDAGPPGEHPGTSAPPPITAATRALLLAFAGGDVSAALPRVDADWDELLDAICRHGILPLAHACLAARPAGDYPPAAFRRQVGAAAAVNRLHMATMYDRALTVLARLVAAGVEVLVAKGLAVAHTIYPDPALRSFTDLDLIVRERDWAAVHRALLDQGFLPQEDRPEPPPKLAPGLSPYEWQYWHPRMRFLVEIHYEDLLNSGLTSRDVDGFWKRAIAIEVHGAPVRALALDDQLIHLAAHAHYHGYTRLNWLSDLAFLVRDHGHAVDWSRFVGTVRREEAQVPVYFTLRILAAALGVEAPADALAAIRPDPLRRRLHEHYLPTARVLSLQPMPRPDFSFFFSPLFKRMLPDLLVMGRRWEKLRLLPRVLVPPAAWLRDYYHVGTAEPVARHYILHPFKLGYHYLVELGQTLGRHGDPDKYLDKTTTE